jgi:putative glycerol-1-phosphate prenyltransferase
MKLYQQLLDIRDKKGAGYFVLLDPDKKPVKEMVSMAVICEENGVDGLLMGGSILFSSDLDEMVRTIKKSVTIPVILFPGNGGQLTKHADGVLFMSLISGRNPHYLIGEQVLAAPIVRSLGLETIATGYMLVESGSSTSVEFMSNTRPLPRNHPEITVAHALAGEYLGMKLLYLEAGSGAEQTVPEDMIQAVKKSVSVPLVVGGGIRTPEQAEIIVKAGASFIVTGNILEKNENSKFVKLFARAAHYKENSPEG